MRSVNILEKADTMSNKNEEGFPADNQSLIFPEFKKVGSDTDDCAVVIDGASLYNVAKSLGYDIDFRMLSMVLKENFPALRIKYYLTAEHFSNKEGSHERGHSVLRPLLDFLDYNDYKVITREIDSASGFRGGPNDDSSLMEVEIVSTLFNVARFSKHIIFFGSHRHYAYPLNMIREWGINVTVVSSKDATGPRKVADELRRIGNFVDLNDDFFREHIAKKENRARKYSIVENENADADDTTHFLSGVGDYKEPKN